MVVLPLRIGVERFLDEGVIDQVVGDELRIQLFEEG